MSESQYFSKLLVPDDDMLMPIVEQVLTDIESKQLQKYLSAHRPKAQIHTWLSWQSSPGTPMGLAITKNYFSTHQQIGKYFVEWLTTLYKS
ncbi:MAG: hypothetical protein JNM36_00910 [Chitinophagales bacterium]|jgi:hypothetical protein|nr:hypothetical protein [Chitinophagales bacterium]